MLHCVFTCLAEWSYVRCRSHIWFQKSVLLLSVSGEWWTTWKFYKYSLFCENLLLISEVYDDVVQYWEMQSSAHCHLASHWQFWKLDGVILFPRLSSPVVVCTESSGWGILVGGAPPELLPLRLLSMEALGLSAPHPRDPSGNVCGTFLSLPSDSFAFCFYSFALLSSFFLGFWRGF